MERLSTDECLLQPRNVFFVDKKVAASSDYDYAIAGNNRIYYDQ